MAELRYEIAWTGRAKRSVGRLPDKVATAAVEFIYGSLADNPHRVGKPLTLAFEGLHSARRGAYRIIYRIDDSMRVVEIVAIGHRANIYRARPR